MSVVSLDVHRRRRHGVQAIAVLEFPDGSSCPCMLLDLSCAGARLGLVAERSLGDRFTLRVSAGSRVRRGCRLLWQQGDEICVGFDRQADRCRGEAERDDGGTPDAFTESRRSG